MFCSKCGKEIPAESTFCPSCGNKIEPSSEASPVTVSPPVPDAPQPVVSNSIPSQTKSKQNLLFIIGGVVGGLLLLSILGLGGYYALKQFNLIQADKSINEAAENLGETKTTDTVASKKVTNADEAYKVAATKVTYAKAGVSVMKVTAKEDGTYGSYEFTFIDRNSLFKKDGYNYFKAKRVMVIEDGTSTEEDVDQFAGNSSTVLSDFGNTDVSNGKIGQMVAEGKKDLQAKGYQLGGIYSVFFSDDQSNLDNSRDKIEVYFTKAGQDETSKGFKKLNAYVVRLTTPTLAALEYADGTLSFVLE